MQTPVQIQGRFLEDSVRIGQEIHYALVLKHSKQQEFFFPSQSPLFRPFELVKKEYFATKTDAKGLSTDSALYTLRLFQPVKTPSLRLPVYLIQDQDCTSVYAPGDGLKLVRLEPNASKVNLRSIYEGLAFSPLPKHRDAKTLFAIGLGVLLVLALVYWLLGKTLRMYLGLYFLWRKNQEFRRNFQRSLRNIKGNAEDLRRIEKAFILWKAYLEGLTGAPFTTFTSKEILDHLADKRLELALSAMDSAIYGGNVSADPKTITEALLVTAMARYQGAQIQLRRRFNLKKA